MDKQMTIDIGIDANTREEIGTGPRVYERWRTSTLGKVTEALEQERILELVGSIDGRRVLDLRKERLW